MVKKRKRREYMKRGYFSGKKKVKCKCPLCEVIHTKMIRFTGNGMPRKYCRTCLMSPIIQNETSFPLEQYRANTRIEVQETVEV